MNTLITNNVMQALTPEDVAFALKMNKATIYRKIKTGEIPAKKIGNDYRIPATYIHYFQTGMDYDIYEKEQRDAQILSQHQDILRASRQRS